MRGLGAPPAAWQGPPIRKSIPTQTQTRNRRCLKHPVNAKPRPHRRIGADSDHRSQHRTTGATFDDADVLDYRNRSGHSGEWEPMNYVVWLDWTICGFGGRRVWWLCQAAAGLGGGHPERQREQAQGHALAHLLAAVHTTQPSPRRSAGRHYNKAGPGAEPTGRLGLVAMRQRPGRASQGRRRWSSTAEMGGGG